MTGPVTQQQQIEAWMLAARERAIVAADALATRSGQPPFAREERKPFRPVYTRDGAGDLEVLATVGEAVVTLAGEVDRLKAELAATKNTKGATS